MPEDKVFYLQIESEEFSGIVGPFYDLTYANTWASRMVPNGSWERAEVYAPHDAAVLLR